MAKEFFVYYDTTEYDNEHPWNWIEPKMGKDIAEFLEGEGFQILNADRLRNVMLSVVKREEEEGGEERIVVIVFAQDIAPDTVLNDSSPTALVRQYLDNGGSIIWIGDIPFWQQVKTDGNKRDHDWWQKGAPTNILGVNPAFPAQLSRAKITRAGKTFGLKSEWTGIRPVLITKEIKVLAKAKCNTAVAYQPLPPTCWVKQLWNRLTGISLGVGTLVNLGFKLDSPVLPKQENILRNKDLANAWFKNFDASNPRSGFFRIWDYIPAALIDEQLEDLHNLANSAGGK
jgi:hypothetical protein